MHFLALAFCCLPQSGEHVFVELVAQPQSAYVEQPIHVTIRFGVEREFLQHNLLQLFTRPLEVPVQLEIPWESALAGAQLFTLDVAESGEGTLVPHPSFALGEAIERATRTREEQRAGSTFVVLEIERGLVPLAAGTLAVPGPVLHYAFATRFEEDLAAGSVPLDKQSAELEAAPLSLAIQALPREGRPPDFDDAVGRFTLAAQAEPRELDLGASLKLVLTISGAGNLARLQPPRLDSLPGLHLLGRTDEVHGDTRTMQAELAPDSPRTREVPAITLAFFDPDARAYRSASTQPIPLVIRVSSPAGQVGFAAAGSVFVLLAVSALVLLALAWGITRLVRRRRA
jgi:hypothetical protein